MIWVIRVTEHLKIDDVVIDKGDVHEIMDPVWWTMNIYDGEQKYLESVAQLSQGQRHLCAVMWYLAEVDNGGHDQFYWNPTGIVWEDALAGFTDLGIDEAVQILRESASRICGHPSLDKATRWAQMRSSSPEYDDLDIRLFKLVETIDVNEAMLQYIRRHRSAFYFDGKVRRYKPRSRRNLPRRASSTRRALLSHRHMTARRRRHQRR
jgi:hypothetical protein